MISFRVCVKSLANKIASDRKIIILAFVSALVFSLAVGVINSRAYSDQVSSDISGELIRFHVRANSDSDEDQRLKEYVRERLLEYLRGGLSTSSSKSETYELLYSRLHEIKAYAEKVVLEKGYKYKVEAVMTREFFPTRVYGDITLPAGEYDTLRIDIGSAKGQNWWCVLFPPLCYVDITQKEIPAEEKDLLKSVLSNESYELITHAGDPQIRIKFKTVELWQNLKAGTVSVKPVLADDSDSESGARDDELDFIGAIKDRQKYGPTETGILMSVIPEFTKSAAPTSSEKKSDPQNFGAAGDEAEGLADQKEREIMLLASVINGEARGEHYTGQVAVGAVVLNRVSHPSFPDTLEAVIYQPGAFDAVRDGQINLTPSESCIRAAKEALAGADPTGGALYYWNPKIATCRWINNIPVTIAIGNHNFGV